MSVNQVPSDSEQDPLPAADWQDLEPSLPGDVSSEVSTTVDKWNQACPLPGPSPPSLTIGEILQDLQEIEAEQQELTLSPPVEKDTRPMLTSPARTEDTVSLPQSPFSDGLIEDLPVPSPTETVLYDENMELISIVTSETVQETLAPLMIARSVNLIRTPSLMPAAEPTRVVVARPRTPTIAKKCPRKQFRLKKVVRAGPPLQRKLKETQCIARN